MVKVLSKVGFLPKPPPPFGSSTLYPKPQPEEKIVNPSGLRDLGAANPFRKEVEAMEKANEERKQSYSENAHKQFYVRNSQPPDKEIQEYMEKYSQYLEKISQLIPEDAEHRMQTFAKLLGLLNTENNKFYPRSLADELGIPVSKAEKILKSYRSICMHFDKADLDDFKYNLSRKSKRGLRKGEKFYVPPLSPMTPVPDFEDQEHLDLPFKLFEIQHPVRPNKDYAIKILPNPQRAQAMAKKKKQNFVHYFSRNLFQ